ncbi:hypothetical protein HMPREF9370_0188 [Neisseria wadsworthii 9715]|uniref:Uncharacterized protein n=1 Tax=Neisseria wadsworthii 9715 TaxID=1030841 RepID=G4CM79_9NEIS|nr:hypothetical protein HMPREF9370_0188 [Neisseria wadsworthii 9715]
MLVIGRASRNACLKSCSLIKQDCKNSPIAKKLILIQGSNAVAE